MYYSVLIDSKDFIKSIILIDQTNIDKIKKEIVIPYLNGEEIFLNGCVLKKSKIYRIKIISHTKTLKYIIKFQNQDDMKNDYTKEDAIYDDDFVTDITNDIFSEVKNELEKNLTTQNANVVYTSNKVFIVHGHDEKIKWEVSNFLRKLGLEPIILHEQVNQGKTIIEKIEENTEVGYGIVLYTPCDKGGTANIPYENMQFRARQNVVFEHGYLIGKLGRNSVCALVDGDIERPSDISGIVYISYSDNWKLDICRELKTVGYNVNTDKLL